MAWMLSATNFVWINLSSSSFFFFLGYTHESEINWQMLSILVFSHLNFFVWDLHHQGRMFDIETNHRPNIIQMFSKENLIPNKILFQAQINCEKFSITVSLCSTNKHHVRPPIIKKTYRKHLKKCIFFTLAWLRFNYKWNKQKFVGYICIGVASVINMRQAKLIIITIELWVWYFRIYIIILFGNFLYSYFEHIHTRLLHNWFGNFDLFER